MNPAVRPDLYSQSLVYDSKIESSCQAAFLATKKSGFCCFFKAFPASALAFLIIEPGQQGRYLFVSAAIKFFVSPVLFQVCDYELMLKRFCYLLRGFYLA